MLFRSLRELPDLEDIAALIATAVAAIESSGGSSSSTDLADQVMFSIVYDAVYGKIRLQNDQDAPGSGFAYSTVAAGTKAWRRQGPIPRNLASGKFLTIEDGFSMIVSGIMQIEGEITFQGDAELAVI